MLKFMNLLKIILMSFVAIAAAVYGASFLLPTNLQLEQTIVLNASPEQVYPLLSNPMEWEKWSAVNKQTDPSMIRLFGGPVSGEGARMQWSGDKVGSGQVELIQSIAPAMVIYKESIAGDATVLEGNFRLAAVEGGTAVFWSQKAQLQDKPLAKLKGVWLKYKKQNELEEGLQRLKSSLDNAGVKKTERKRVAVS